MEAARPATVPASSGTRGVFGALHAADGGSFPINNSQWSARTHTHQLGVEHGIDSAVAPHSLPLRCSVGAGLSDVRRETIW